MGSADVHLNGIDPTTGNYLVEPLPLDAMYEVAKRREAPPELQAQLEWWHYQVSEGSFGPKEGVDATDIGDAGWGIVFHQDADPEVRDALSPLIELRRKQASSRHDRFREFWGPDAYRTGESKHRFLTRVGPVGPGPADPDKVPYYLLMVGSPVDIPYEVQHELDIQYAVGRLDFRTTAEYHQYALSVVESETGSRQPTRRATFFGTDHPGDRATQLTSSLLVRPAAEHFRSESAGWSIDSLTGPEATRGALLDVLSSPDRPDFLFSATHGLGYPAADPQQPQRQGALLCQDFVGVGSGPIKDEHCVSAADVPDTADLSGLIMFMFACFGGGTPRFDRFEKEPKELAPSPFTSPLPQRLLGNGSGGASAIVAHIDRAWSYSFDWGQAGAQTEVFNSTLRRLVKGWPIGAAIEYFNERFAELSTTWHNMLEEERFGKSIDRSEASMIWIANEDAKGFTILGDPAVRLAGMAGEDGRTKVADAVAEPATASGVVPAETGQLVHSDLAPAGVSSIEPAESAVPAAVESAVPPAAAELAEAWRAAGGSAPVEVNTYITGSAGEARSDGDVPVISTRIAVGGATVVKVHHDVADDDRAVFDLHVNMVREANRAHLEVLRALSANPISEDEPDGLS